MKRRDFLKTAGAGSLLLSAGVSTSQTSQAPLPILPMTDLLAQSDNRIELQLKAATHDFGNGVASKTLGINHSYLGPILRAKQGQTLPFNVINAIDETSTIHWHGLHIDGRVDGGPHQEIQPGQTWAPDVPIVQHASMNWFHSHMHGKTAQQTYNGLAGILLVEDDASLSADLPQTYGVDDFTLVLQDKTFDGQGQMNYVLSGEVFEEGFQGDTLIVNGVIAPTQQSVPGGLVRLRILNACNARFLSLSMETGPLHVIASDGGFLASTVETESLLMSPGERYELLVDMATVDSNSLWVEFRTEGITGFLGGLFNHNQTPVLTLNSTNEKGFTGSMPNHLANLAPPETSSIANTRDFSLEMDGDSAKLNDLALQWGNYCGDLSAMGINGQPMNMERIDEEVHKGDTEIWRITVDEDLHPFHIHGCSFRILSQSGATPPAYAQGWKDMVHVEDSWSEVLVQFNYHAPADAPYMYHCHILEHEDCGMMGQFTVT